MPGTPEYRNTCTESKLQQREGQRSQKDFALLTAMKLLKFQDNDSSSWMVFPANNGCIVSGLPSLTRDALRSSPDELSIAKPGKGGAHVSAAQLHMGSGNARMGNFEQGRSCTLCCQAGKTSCVTHTIFSYMHSNLT